MKEYAFVEDGFYSRYVPPRTYDSESINWQPGEPSRVGLEMPLTEYTYPTTLYQYIDLEGVEPRPQIGWSYDYETGKFSEPLPPYIDPRPAIFAELEQIDKDSARPLRTLIIANPDIGAGTSERAELENLELRAIALRSELDALPPAPGA